MTRVEFQCSSRPAVRMPYSVHERCAGPVEERNHGSMRYTTELCVHINSAASQQHRTSFPKDYKG